MTLKQTIDLLPAMAVKDLRLKYAEVFGDQTNANNRDWLVKRIAWRLQAQNEGGLSERAKQRAKELANEADLRVLAPASTPHLASQPRTATNDCQRPGPSSPEPTKAKPTASRCWQAASAGMTPPTRRSPLSPQPSRANI